MTWCCVECGFSDNDSEKVTDHLMVEHKYPREVAELSAVFVAEDNQWQEERGATGKAEGEE
jgi:hypothetical protein